MKSTLRILLVVFGLFWTLSFNAQNLVTNGSFENYWQCPNGLSNITKCWWRQPISHIGSADYFHACATSTANDVPNNIFGSSLAAQGDAYVGGYCMLGYTGSYAAYREYVMDTLTQPLVAGQQYIVSFQYRLGDNARYATDDLGFWLSSAHPTMTGTPNYGALGVTPTSHNASGNYLTNNNAWATYADTITASGGETYITIGSFNALPAGILYNTSASISGAYMYYDDVWVEEYMGIGGDSNICEGDSAIIYAYLEESFFWVESSQPNNVISTLDTIVVWPTVNSTYYCIGDSTGDTFSWDVNIVTFPSNFVGDDTTVCDGDTVMRVINLPQYTFAWSDGSTDSALITADSGYHHLTIEQYGCEAVDTFLVEFYPFPSLSLGNDTSICSYDSITVTTGLGGTVSYLWSTGSIQPTISVSDSAVVWVAVTNQFCTRADTMQVSVFPEVTIDLGLDEDVCYDPDSSITPVASFTQNASSYSWSTGQSTPTISVTLSGTYTVTASGNGCVAEDSVEITFHTDPDFNLGVDTSYCEGDTVALTINLDPATHTFFWNNGSIKQTQMVHSGSQGGYWAQASNGICAMRDTIYVDQFVPMNLDLPEFYMACEGDIISIIPNTNVNLSYNWNTGSTSKILQVGSNGTYFLTVTDGFCFESDQTSALFFDYPEISIGNDTITCGPSELTFEAISNISSVNFKWYNGSISAKHTTYIDRDQTIWAKAVNEVCSTTDSIYITLEEPPTVQVIDDTLLCEGKTAKVTAKGSDEYSYKWSNGIEGKRFETTEPGTYVLLVNDSVCTSEYDVLVTDFVVPTFEITGPEYICLGEQIELDASTPGIMHYRWFDGNIGPTHQVTDFGYYSVEGWHACGIVNDTIFIEDCECFIHFPTAFRPTPEGVNKTFGPKVDCEFEDFKFTIYNRWGEIIYKSEVSNESWDGTYLNEAVPAGAYGWMVEYKAIKKGQEFQNVKHGTVIVLR